MVFRWIALATVLACLGISIFYRRRARRDGGTIPRRDEKPLFVAARLIIGFPLWLAVLAYLVSPDLMRWSSFLLPDWLRWVGAGLGSLTVPTAVWVFRSIGSNVSETTLTKPNHRLVTHGPYRWVRHPLYSMGLALLLAIGLMAANWFILLFALITLISIRMAVVPAEEKVLVETFGEEYRNYMLSTGRLLPRVGAPQGRGGAP